MSSRMNELYGWEVGAVAGCVSGEQAKTANGGVSADVEVGQRVHAMSAPPAIFQKGLSRQESSLERQVFPLVERRGKRELQVLDPVESDGNLGIDEGIDRQSRFVCCRFEGARGPREPSRIGRRNVEDDVAVDEHGTHRPRRVRARIASVDILTVTVPLRRATTSWPLPRVRLAGIFTRRAEFPCISKSTSVLGRRPSFSRMSIGIVTCPLVVIRMYYSCW